MKANGVAYRDDTPAIKAMLARPRDDLAERLRTREFWGDLTALVQVQPNRDLFPSVLNILAATPSISALTTSAPTSRNGSRSPTRSRQKC